MGTRGIWSAWRSIIVFIFIIGSTGLGHSPAADAASFPPNPVVDWESLDLPFSDAEWDHILKNCMPEKPDDPFLYWSDFRGSVDKEGLKARYKTIYYGDKRLKHRSYYDPEMKEFRIPWAREEGRSLKVPKRFIRAVIRHVEEALKNEYVEAVMFSDMGHNHFNIPEDRYASVYSKLEDYGLSYEMKLADPTLIMVYHTAEQLNMVDRGEDRSVVVRNDRQLGWRYYTRNLVAENDPTKRLNLRLERDFIFNTVKGLPGYHWGAGIDLSANKSGCFPFNKDGKTYYFDISLEALTNDPKVPVSGDYY